MTTGELGGGLGDDAPAPAKDPVSATAEATLSVPEILDLTDQILSERGRRSHLFAWLKRPGGGPADWLAVDAYYPASRVVVVCRDTAGPYGEVFAEQVPAHGLRLLEVDPNLLAGGREAARHTLERRIAQLDPPRDRAAPSISPTSRPPASPAPLQPQLSRSTRERQLAGAFAGVALAALLVAEVYVGVARVGFDSGHLLLGFGLALDACSRGVGTIAARRAGSSEWAWWCAIGGSPVVAWFALFQEGGPERTEPAPLGGLIGILALLVLAVGLLVAAL